jgi:hypothetical protein
LTKVADLKKYGTQYYCDVYGDATQSADSIGGPIEWDCSGQTSGLASQDVNRDNTKGKLAGFDDWSHLVLKSAPGAGVTPPRPRTKLKDELTLAKANLISLRSVSQVFVAQKDRGVVLQWDPVPSERIVAYEISRSAAGEQVTIGAANAKDTTFVDEKAPKGRLSYKVRAVYKPLGNPATVRESKQLVSHPVLLTKEQFAEISRVSPQFKLEAMKVAGLWNTDVLAGGGGGGGGGKLPGGGSSGGVKPPPTANAAQDEFSSRRNVGGKIGS